MLGSPHSFPRTLSARNGKIGTGSTQRPFDHGQAFAARALHDGKHVLSVSARTIKIWDRETGSLRKKIELSRSFPTRHVAIRRGGSILLLHESRCYQFCVETLKLAEVIDDPVNHHRELLLSPSDDYLTTLGGSGADALCMFSTATGKKLWSWSQVENHSSYEVEFSSDSKYLLWELEVPQQSGSELMAFGVCDVRTGRVICSECETFWRERAYFSEDETTLCFGSRTGSPPKVSFRFRRKGSRAAPHDRQQADLSLFRARST